jgi:hypothetical protein
MKIQCNCGAKYSFDVTPEMAQNPIRFICPTCGLDSSVAVNSLIIQELRAAGTPPPVLAPAAAPPARLVARAVGPSGSAAAG